MNCSLHCHILQQPSSDRVRAAQLRGFPSIHRRCSSRCGGPATSHRLSSAAPSSTCWCAPSIDWEMPFHLHWKEMKHAPRREGTRPSKGGMHGAVWQQFCQVAPGVCPCTHQEKRHDIPKGRCWVLSSTCCAASCCACSLWSAAQSMSHGAAWLLSASCRTRLSVAASGCMQGHRHQLLDGDGGSVLQLRKQPSSHPAAPHRGTTMSAGAPDPGPGGLGGGGRQAAAQVRFLLHASCFCACKPQSASAYIGPALRLAVRIPARSAASLRMAILGICMNKPWSCVMQRTKHRPQPQDLRPALLNRHRLDCRSQVQVSKELHISERSRLSTARRKPMCILLPVEC